MTVNPTSAAGAASAYAQAAGRVIEDAAASAGAAGASGSHPSFADFVKDSIGSAIDASKASETASLNAVNGKADVVDLVTAVNEAEMMVQTVVAVRDKVVQAYQEIMRMPI